MEKLEKLKAFLGRDVVKEVFGVVFIAFSILTVISLVSHNPADTTPSLMGERPPVGNLAGLGGAYLAWTLTAFLGSSAFAVPVIALAFGILLFRSDTGTYAMPLLGGGALFVLAVCSLMNVFFAGDPRYPDVPPGGYMGLVFAGKFLIRLFAKPGAAVIGFTLLFVSFLVATRLSVAGFAALAGDFFRNALPFAARAAGGLYNGLRAAVERLRERREKTEEKGETPAVPEVKAPPENPKILKAAPVKDAPKPEETFKAEQAAFGFLDGMEEYQLPPLSYLTDPRPLNRDKSEKELITNSQILTKKLADFGIDGRVTTVLPGPVITLYEFEPAAGVKVSRIVGLADDLAMGLRAISVRILAPVPGKPVVGIEVPNNTVSPVGLKQILVSEEFAQSRSRITLALGVDTQGVPVVTDLAQIPHLLIAGATGSGKSVGLNGMVMSVLCKSTPAEVNFIMIDPKMLELAVYDGIPHLIAPVVTNPKKAANALRWAVSEMERRYHLLADLGFRNISGYNEWVVDFLKERKEKRGKGGMEKPVEKKFDSEGPVEEGEGEKEFKPLPYIVVVIDELADLMMVASKEVEDCITRLAQMARASGIHLIVATQRPSVDVLTGLIKANFPARISYQVTSRIDSRTILDTVGAERLLGKGDMLFLPPGTSRLQRIHGPFVSDEEVKRVVEFLRKQGKPTYNEEILMMQAKADEAGEEEDEGVDEEFFEQAVGIVAQTRQASISMIQRKLRIGYNRAARIIELMEAKGMVGPADGAKPRQVFIPPPREEMDDIPNL